jgi:hypothetical protein
MKLIHIYNRIEGECRDKMNSRTKIINAVQSFIPEIESLSAKLDERKTVHQWLNQIGVPDKEGTGKPMCLLRRLAVALKIQAYIMEEGK